MFYSPTVLPGGATGSQPSGRHRASGREGMTRLLLASVSTMLLTTIAGPAWSQAPAPGAPAAPAAQPSRPAIETKKVEGTDNVYIFRNQNHQAMFIVTNDGVIAT